MGIIKVYIFYFVFVNILCAVENGANLPAEFQQQFASMHITEEGQRPFQREGETGFQFTPFPSMNLSAPMNAELEYNAKGDNQKPKKPKKRMQVICVSKEELKRLNVQIHSNKKHKNRGKKTKKSTTPQRTGTKKRTDPPPLKMRVPKAPKLAPKYPREFPPMFLLDGESQA